MIADSFSDNIYAELNIEDLRSEYKKVKNEINDANSLIQMAILKDDQNSRYYVASLQRKRKAIKEALGNRLKKEFRGNDG